MGTAAAQAPVAAALATLGPGLAAMTKPAVESASSLACAPEWQGAEGEPASSSP